MIIYRYKLFSNREEAVQFQREHGGKLYNLDMEKRKKPNKVSSICLLDCDIVWKLTDKDKYSVEWNEVVE